MVDTATTLEIPGAGGVTRHLRVSSPDREIWPGITKLDLANYFLSVATPFLAAVGDRPVTLQRFKGSVADEEFYSKNPPKGMPDWIRTVVVTYPSARAHPQLVIDEIAAAVWAVQMNTVTFHPWPVRTANLDNPDELRIDLDPQPGTGFPEAVQAALLLRDVLTELDYTPFVKTSGNRGLHVFAPIKPTHEFLDVRHGVIAIARELERRAPDLVTTAWWKEERGAKIFADFNQANRDRTLASAYSPRPLEHAPVSFPVAWEDLTSINPRDFTVRTAPEIVASREDPWASFRDTAGDIQSALDLWDRDVANGLGELNFPPDYPKMPGEPPRVQPSKKNAANWE